MVMLQRGFRTIGKSGVKIVVVTCLVLLAIYIFLSSINLNSTLRQRIAAQEKLQEEMEVEIAVGKRPYPMMPQTIRRTVYPKRRDMGHCPPIFGKIKVFVAFLNASIKTKGEFGLNLDSIEHIVSDDKYGEHLQWNYYDLLVVEVIEHYGVAQKSLQCYLRGTNYELLMVDLDNDPIVKQHCSKHADFTFRKHCAVAEYVKQTDWLLVLDADTGVANPNHCLEEYIDDRVSVVLYERFFNYEIAVGNYLVRNTEYGINFAKSLAEWEFKRPVLPFGNSENAVLVKLVLDLVLWEDAPEDIKMCDQIWAKSKDYDTYMAFVQCVKILLGANKVWPGKLRIHKRGHGMVRDGFMTTDRFCDHDFMFHGWKLQEVGLEGWESPFTTAPDPSKCGYGYQGWDFRKGKSTTIEEIKKDLAGYEKSIMFSYANVSRVHPWFEFAEIGNCFPNCEPDMHNY